MFSISSISRWILICTCSAWSKVFRPYLKLLLPLSYLEWNIYSERFPATFAHRVLRHIPFIVAYVVHIRFALLPMCRSQHLVDFTIRFQYSAWPWAWTERMSFTISAAATIARSWSHCRNHVPASSVYDELIKARPKRMNCAQYFNRRTATFSRGCWTRLHCAAIIQVISASSASRTCPAFLLTMLFGSVL